METERAKLNRAAGLRITDGMHADVLAYQTARRLRDFSDAARELMSLGIEATRGDTAEILDAVRLVRESGVDPLGVLRAAQERALVIAVEVPA